MKVAILAGGKGTRLVEETETKSKSMVRIGGWPILWHIMKYYACFGLFNFIVALGYQAESIRTYFETEIELTGPVIHDGPRIILRPRREPSWTIELVDTGVETMSGGRIKRLGPYLDSNTFMLTWCDGLADIDLRQLFAFHQAHGRLATLTAAHPPPLAGRLQLTGDRVSAFADRSVDRAEWINGAFFVLDRRVLDRIAGDSTQWEQEPLTRLAEDGELMAYRHESFWQCMDKLPEALLLNELWRSGIAPWKRWV